MKCIRSGLGGQVDGAAGEAARIPVRDCWSVRGTPVWHPASAPAQSSCYTTSVDRRAIQIRLRSGSTGRRRSGSCPMRTDSFLWALCPTGRPARHRHQRNQTEHVAAIQRHLQYFSRFDHLTERGVFGLQQRRLGRNFDYLSHIAELHRDVDADRALNFNRDRFPGEAAKTGSRDFDPVISRDRFRN